jgi:hypothetical protein
MNDPTPLFVWAALAIFMLAAAGALVGVAISVFRDKR